MYGTLEKFNQTGQITPAPQPQQTANPQAPPQYPAQPAPQPGVNPPATLADDDYATGGQIRAWGANQMAQFQQQNQAQLSGYALQMAGLAKSQVREKHRDVWDKYAPEIEGHLAGVAPEAQTVDTLELVVKLVKGNHTEEIVEAALRERGAINAEPTMRSTGGETATTDTAPQALTIRDERVPSNWRERAEGKGIDDAKIDEWCQMQGITKEQFYDDFDRKSMTAPEAK